MQLQNLEQHVVLIIRINVLLLGNLSKVKENIQIQNSRDRIKNKAYNIERHRAVYKKILRDG